MAADACGISVHGFANANVSVVCVGGGNTDLASEVARHLRVAVDRRPFEVHYPCAIFAGKDPPTLSTGRGRGPAEFPRASDQFRVRASPLEMAGLCRALSPRLRMMITSPAFLAPEFQSLVENFRSQK